MFSLKIAEFLDKLVLLLALLVFAGVGWLGIVKARELDRLGRGQTAMPSESKIDVQPVKIEPLRANSVKWMTPLSQGRGSKWVFDVFTPPVIYYNPVSQEFAVTPPNLEGKQESPDPWSSFGLELVEVRQRPYRLQLVGYAGEPGNYIANFEYVPTGETLLAREGQLLVEVGAKILSFDVRQMRVEQEGNMPVYENVGVALIMDYEQNEEFYLTNLETKIFSDLEAKVRSLADGQEYVVREGSQVKLEQGVYIIGGLSSEPPEVMVTKVSEDGNRRQSKLLTPVDQKQVNLKNTKPASLNTPFIGRENSQRLARPQG